MDGLKDNYGAEIGARVICQRCGKQVFMQQTGYNTIDAASENRHSLLDQFEPMPKGWEIKHDLGGWCCSDCVEEYNIILENFKKGKLLVEEIQGEKQIEEMARDLCCMHVNGLCTADGKPCDCDCSYYEKSKVWYNKGYRKQGDGEWIEKDGELYCSACGYEALMDETYYRSPHCPYCGVKMKNTIR